MQVKKLVKVVLAAAVALHMTNAEAGSYQLNDYSVTGLGRSYAGQGIVGDDYSAIAFNPAGMTLMKKSGIQTGATFVNLRADVEGLEQHAGKHKKMDFWAPIPQFFGQYNVNDKFSLGFGVYAPFGLKTKYDSGWFASDTAILSKLDMMDFNVSAAYKLNQHWSIGASAIMRYIYGKMTNTIPVGKGGGKSEFDVHGWTQTATLGVMYEHNENTRFGVSYRLRSAQKTKGDFDVGGNLAYLMGGPNLNVGGNVWANPDLPESVILSGYHRYKKFGFSGTARWTHWTSSFPEFIVRSDHPLIQAIGGAKISNYKYQNSWTLTGGVDYYYCKNLTFRFGGGWDESPTHKPEHRTIRIPDNDRWWMSVGASYMKNNWQLDVGYAHMIAKTSKALEPGADPVKYKNMQSHILGVQVQYKF